MNKDYWAERFKLIENDAYTKSAKLAREIDDIYKYSLSKIEKDIDVWYQRFADNNSITYNEAKKQISSKELRELQWNVKDYVQKGQDNSITGMFDKELENASSKFHIDRLEALKYQIQTSSEDLFRNMTDSLDTHLKDIYKEGYYRSAYEIQKGLGVGFDVAKIDTKFLNMVINKPWADDGSNFSERIWGKYRPTLVNRLHRDLTDCIIRGDNPNNLVDALAKDFKTSSLASRRLIMSEYAYFNSLAEQNSLLELGVEEFEVLETLDGTTCELCQGMDCKHYPISQYEIGITAPPFHNFCRGTTIPYLNDEFTQNAKRAARDPETGKTVYIDDMSYKDWKEKFVKEKGQEAWDLYEKSAKNDKVDKEQFQRYKDVLGKNAPESLEEFQKLKYTNKEEWEDLKTALKDKKLQDEIRESYNLNIHEGSQGKHILGHNNYIEGRSYLTISIEEVQELINKYAGTGKMLRTVNGNWRNQEIIKSSDKIVGVDINNLTGECYETSFFKIHYSKNKGVHIVPYREDITL